MGYIKCHLSRILGERRISQRELARQSRLSTFTINRIYNEEFTGLELLTIAALCKALGVQVGDLFEYVEEIPKQKKGKGRGVLWKK